MATDPEEDFRMTGNDNMQSQMANNVNFESSERETNQLYNTGDFKSDKIDNNDTFSSINANLNGAHNYESGESVHKSSPGYTLVEHDNPEASNIEQLLRLYDKEEKIDVFSEENCSERMKDEEQKKEAESQRILCYTAPNFKDNTNNVNDNVKEEDPVVYGVHGKFGDNNIGKNSHANDGERNILSMGKIQNYEQNIKQRDSPIYSVVQTNKDTHHNINTADVTNIVVYNNNLQNCDDLIVNKGKRKKHNVFHRICFCFFLFLQLPCRILSYLKRKVLCKMVILNIICGVIALGCWILALFTLSWRVHRLIFDNEMGHNVVITNSGLLYAQRIQKLYKEDGSSIFMLDKPTTFMDLQRSPYCTENNEAVNDNNSVGSVKSGSNEKHISIFLENVDSIYNVDYAFFSRRPDAIGNLSSEEAELRRKLLGATVWDLECKGLSAYRDAGIALWIMGIMVAIFEVVGCLCNFFVVFYDSLYSSEKKSNHELSGGDAGIADIGDAEVTEGQGSTYCFFRRNDKATQNNDIIQWIKYNCICSWVLAWILLVMGLSIWGNFTDSAVCTSESGGSEVCRLGCSAISGILSLIFTSLCIFFHIIRVSRKNVFQLCSKCSDRPSRTQEIQLYNKQQLKSDSVDHVSVHHYQFDSDSKILIANV